MSNATTRSTNLGRGTNQPTRHKGYHALLSEVRAGSQEDVKGIFQPSVQRYMSTTPYLNKNEAWSSDHLNKFSSPD